MKKKKALLISSIVAIVIVIAGWATLRFGVSFVFDKYVLGTALSSISENELGIITEEEKSAIEKEAGTYTENEESVKSEQVLQEDEKSPDEKTTFSPSSETKRKLTNTEIINRVLKSSTLTNKMASMVSYSDKKRVISIVLSNFTKAELAEIAKNVKGGISSDYKSKMISEARARLTGGQWQECLNIAYKYVDQMRPYVE